MKKIAAMCFSLFMFPASFCTDMRNVAVSKESFRNVDVVSEIIRDAAWVIEDENNIDKLEQTLRQEKYQNLQNAKKLLLTIIGDKKAMTNGTAFLSWVYCRLANPIAKKTNVPASIPSEFYRSSTSALSLEDLLTISNLSKSASTKQSMDLLRAFIPYCICNCQKTLVDIYYGASHFFMNTEHEDIAIKLMERAASNTKPYDNIYDTCHLMLASLLLKNNEEDRGFEVLKHLLEKSSTNPIIRAISTRVLKLFVRGGLGYTQSSPDNAPFRNINFVVSENKKAGDFFKALIYEEMEKISRYPDGNEILAAHAFMDKLNQYDGIHVDAVKYIDAQTLIKGMNISKENRKYLLELIDSSEYGERLFHKIELFLAQSFDDNTELKQKILAEFKYAIRKSKVFRDAMLAFIARVESKPSVSASALYDFRQLYAPVSFLSSESSAISSSSSYNTIKIKDDNSSCISFFPFTYFSEKNKVHHMPRYYKMPLYFTLFHECGHSTSGCFAMTTSDIGIDNSMLLASKFVEITLDKKAYKSRQNLLKQLTPEYQKQFLSQFSNCESIDEYIRWKCRQMNSSSEITESLYDNTTELLQIFGTLLLKNGEKNILYINKLSDFALRMELGMPIRFFHDGMNDMDISKIINELMKNCPPCQRFNVDRELLDMYMRAAGNLSLYEYSKRNSLWQLKQIKECLEQVKEKILQKYLKN